MKKRQGSRGKEEKKVLCRPIRVSGDETAAAEEMLTTETAAAEKANAAEGMAKVAFWRRKLFWLPLIPFLICFAFLQVALRRPDAAEAYARHVFPYVTYLPRLLNTYIPFSLTEVIVVGGGLLLIAALIASLIRLIVKDGRKAFAAKWAWALYLVFCIGFCLFHLNFGFCYHRLPLSENLALEEVPRSTAELHQTALWLVEQVNELAAEVERNEQGHFVPQLSRAEIMQMPAEAYKAAARAGRTEFEKEHLYRGPVRTKPVQLSYYWSYTGITGIYVPFLCESSVNIAPPPDDVIFTALHEVAHSYGFAREDEANFLAFYTGLQHENQDLRYACRLSGFVYVGNALNRENRELYSELYYMLDEGAQNDLRANREFWKQFEGPIEEISDKVNNAYLKVNNVDDGVKSYGRVTDLILAYYADLAGGDEA